MSILAKANGWMIAGKIIGDIDDTIFFQPVDSKAAEMVSKTSKTEKIFENAYIACNWIDEQNGKRPTFSDYPTKETI